MGVPLVSLTCTIRWKNPAMSIGIRTQPCETAGSGTGTSPWMAYDPPMKNTGLYMVPSGTFTQPLANQCAR